MEPQALIIDNKDYYTDNYRISAGRFVADLAVVSCLAISSTDPNSQEAFYIGVPSVGFKIKWDVSPENTVFSFDLQGPLLFLRPSSLKHFCLSRKHI
jgi:hypothetical protein